MNWYTFTASMFDDWRDKYLVYVEASSMKSAYNKLDQAGYADYKYTERPSAYSHLDNDELR
tara:strand:- start:463 stop:645 length:183 start_codon:yes stop_codon:yes gene_type:complete